MAKSKFLLSNYNFKVVITEVFSGEIDAKTNDFTYYLLVDDDNLIHDYKIKFNKLQISCRTTASHAFEENINKQRRLDLIFNLKLSHVYGGKPIRKDIDDPQILAAVNEWALAQSWKDITFQNIEYIITGYNPGGQGSMKPDIGFLKTPFKPNNCVFGFFFKKLNIAKSIANKYEDVDYSSVWDVFFDNNRTLVQTIPSIDFQTWVNKSQYKNYFVEYVCSASNWKNINNKFGTFLKGKLKEFENTDNNINKLRNLQKKNVKKVYGDSKDKIIKQYFQNAEASDFEHAHIKPVKLIRKEYIDRQDTKILEEIADLENFLPLPPTVHTFYDKQFFYWTTSGHLEVVNTNFSTKQIAGFERIDQEQIKHIKKYIQDYKNKIIEPLQRNQHSI